MNAIHNLHRQGAHFVMCGYEKDARSADRKASMKGKAPLSHCGGFTYGWKDKRPSAAEIEAILADGRLFGIVPASMSCAVLDVDKGDIEDLRDYLRKIDVRFKIVPSRSHHHIWLPVTDARGIRDESIQGQWKLAGCAGDTRHNGGYVVIWDLQALTNGIWEGERTISIQDIKKLCGGQEPAKRKNAADADADYKVDWGNAIAWIRKFPLKDGMKHNWLVSVAAQAGYRNRADLKDLALSKLRAAGADDMKAADKAWDTQYAWGAQKLDAKAKSLEGAYDQGRLQYHSRRAG